MDADELEQEVIRIVAIFSLKLAARFVANVRNFKDFQGLRVIFLVFEA